MIVPARLRLRIRTRPGALPGLALLVALAAPAGAQVAPASGTLGTIERKDPRLDQLIAPDARVEKLAQGFDWAEGPLWVPKEGGYLLLSDVPLNAVFRYKDGQIKPFLKPSGYTGTTPRGGEPGSNGLVLDDKNRLVLCQHGDRRIARLEEDGRFTTLIDRYESKRFNSPNDGTFKSNGDFYFTDPPYGLEGNDKDPKKELDFCGVFRLGKDGTLTLLTKELTRPNGIAFAPDEKTLYVANSDPEKAIWMAYPVKDDGTIGAGRVFFDATAMAKAGKKGLPDGLKVDEHGNLFAAGPGGVLVFAPDGTHLGTIDTGEANGNCAWGDDGSALYIAADMFLGRIKTRTRGKVAK